MFQVSPATKLKLETFAIVFGASLLTSIGSQISHLSAGTVTLSVFGSIVTSAVGVAVQAAYNAFIESALGNQLKGVTRKALLGITERDENTL